MAYEKRLGIIVTVPRPGEGQNRLVPPLKPEGAHRLYTAFLEDLFPRVRKLKNIRGTVFYQGDSPEPIKDMIPTGYKLAPQVGTTPGERLENAFATLLDGRNRCAVVIGSNSPDLPLQYIKRAYLKLKHKDAALGPDPYGRCYLVGLSKPAPGLFTGIDWNEPTVLRETLARVRNAGLTVSLLPLWYGLDTPESLALLVDLIEARRLERGDRLPATESALKEVVETSF